MEKKTTTVESLYAKMKDVSKNRVVKSDGGSFQASVGEEQIKASYVDQFKKFAPSIGRERTVLPLKQMERPIMFLDLSGTTLNTVQLLMVSKAMLQSYWRTRIMFPTVEKSG